MSMTSSAMRSVREILDVIKKKYRLHSDARRVQVKLGEVQANTAKASTDSDSAAVLKRNAAEVEVRGRAGDVSPISFPVGFRSLDGTACLGRDGFLFLTGGSNDVLRQYHAPTENLDARKLEAKANLWANRLREYEVAMRSRGVKFLTVVIPEKMTAMRSLAPMNVPGPTVLSARISELMSTSSRYLDCLSVFDSWEGQIPPFQKYDSHFSPAGSMAVSSLILKDLGIEAEDVLGHVEFVRSKHYSGDLASRFFGFPLWEEHLMPQPGAFLDGGLEQIESHDPPGGGHVGRVRVWKNPQAPIDSKIVIFGNSFFSASTDMPSKMSWWFARIFREVHFKWQAKVDLEYVDKVKPDYVVFQSIERFLQRVPE